MRIGSDNGKQRPSAYGHAELRATVGERGRGEAPAVESIEPNERNTTPNGRCAHAPAVRAFVRCAVVAALVAAGWAVLLSAGPPPGPRKPAAIGKVLAMGPHAGECERCHSQHGDGGIAYPHALQGPDDNALCDDCHATSFTPSSGGSYGGTTLYLGSAHGSEAAMVWPGPNPPARTEPGAEGKCVNCHDPHGWTDADGLIPHLAKAREEDLCLTCHDGSPASTNVRLDLLKGSAHPTDTYTGRHTGPDEAQPSDFAVSPMNRRHAECGDCHNPHVARADMFPAQAPEASKRLLGVSRVAVLNGAAGTAPAYTFVPGSDTLTAPVAEYQVCFKCHSSWTAPPPGQTDFGRVLNPNNPSFHPIEAPGTNPNIDPLAFTSGWGAQSMVRCTSCHGSDDPSARGAHGSIFAPILKAPYSTLVGPNAPDELCFQCHDVDVYANPTAPASTLQRSRFNPPGTAQGHAAHVQQQGLSCFSCHATHGSTTLPNLITTDRSPGITSFTRTASDGTCTTTCHAQDPRSYTVNYAR